MYDLVLVLICCVLCFAFGLFHRFKIMREMKEEFSKLHHSAYSAMDSRPGSRPGIYQVDIVELEPGLSLVKVLPSEVSPARSERCKIMREMKEEFSKLHHSERCK